MVAYFGAMKEEMATDTRLEIGQRLKRLREDLGLSQQEVVNRLRSAYGIDIQRSSYSHYEVGQNEVSASTLKALAQILKAPIHWLLGDENVEIIPDDPVYNARFREYTPNQVKEMMNIYDVVKSSQRKIEDEETTHGRKAE